MAFDCFSYSTTSRRGRLWNLTQRPYPRSKLASGLIVFSIPLSFQESAGSLGDRSELILLTNFRKFSFPVNPSFSFKIATSACSKPGGFGLPGFGIGTSIAGIFHPRQAMGFLSRIVVMGLPPTILVPSSECPALIRA